MHGRVAAGYKSQMSSTVLSDCEKDLRGTAFLWLPMVDSSVPAITSTLLLIEIRLNFDSIAPL